jgi:hypothetical protein
MTPRRGPVLAALLTLLLLSGVVFGGPAGAVITDPDDIKVVVSDPQLPVYDGDYNKVTRDVIVTDRKTGEPPEVNYGVFLTYQFGDDESTLTDPTAAPCLQVHYTSSPEIPKGVYRCTAIVDHPGTYRFFAYVNKAAVIGTLGKRLGEATASYDIDKATEHVDGGRGLKYVVEGRLFEVFLLQSHVAAASLWLVLAVVMAFLAVPRLRRMMSVLTLHTLEVRRGFLQSTMWAAFAVTLGSGIYLLRTQTAYPAPFSVAKWDAVTTLPYAQTYFTALYVKILLFLLMGGATVVLVMEANRRAQMSDDADGLELESDDEFWERMKFRDVEADPADVAVAGAAPEPAAGTAVQAKPRAAAAGVSPRTLWACLGVVLGGLAAVGVCVTLLKYCHELIETVTVFKTLNEG